MQFFPESALRDAIQAHVFPGAVVFAARGEKIQCHRAWGDLDYESGQSVSLNTLYDVASLTKIYTLVAFLIVARDARISVETSLRQLFPHFSEAIQLRHLMQHSSGIRFSLQLLEHQNAADWLEIVAQASAERVGQSVHYSCTNYFLLARVAEQIAGQTLDEIIGNRILRSLQLEQTFFVPPDLSKVAPTQADGNGGFGWRGIVHDEAARSWNLQTQTCAGNAGLFACAADVARFAQAWNDPDFLHPADLKLAFFDTMPENNYQRGWGWQIDAPFYMTESAPPGTGGHTGFTGPTLVFHPPSEAVLVILNNRVHPSRSGPNRFPVHRQIARWFFQNL